MTRRDMMLNESSHTNTIIDSLASDIFRHLARNVPESRNHKEQ